MKLKLGLLFCPFFALIACSTQIYEIDEVIAIVNGEEIKAIDIMLQYPLEDKHIENYLKEEIIISEAKKAGLSISEESLKTAKDFFSNEEFHLLTDFQREQAKALNMSVEEYYEIWLTTHLERSEMMQAYVFTTFGVPTEEETDTWERKVEDHFEHLVETYIANGDLVIKYK